ncbi:MAG UNVERIFIED_CONTAM: MoaD/ThiS family protein [Anaerolineae bacterium]
MNGNLLPDKEVEYAHTHSVIRWATRLPPPAQRGKTTLSVSEGATVHDVLAQLGIRTPVIVNINETHEVEPSYPVREGDKLLVVGHSSVVDPAPLTFWQHFRTAYPAYADSVATAFGERPRWIKQLIEWWRFRSRWRWCAWDRVMQSLVEPRWKRSTRQRMALEDVFGRGDGARHTTSPAGASLIVAKRCRHGRCHRHSHLSTAP